MVDSTHLKNISHSGSFPQVGVKIEIIWNHHLDWIPSEAETLPQERKTKNPEKSKQQTPTKNNNRNIKLPQKKTTTNKNGNYVKKQKRLIIKSKYQTNIHT